MKHYFWNVFTNIKNGQLAKKNYTYQRKTKLCESVLKILWNEGFLIGYKTSRKNNFKIFLKYHKNGKPSITNIRYVSKPGQRIYYSLNQIWKIDSNKSFIIFSTNRGLKTILECKKQKVGGEPLIAIN